MAGLFRHSQGKRGETDKPDLPPRRLGSTLLNPRTAATPYPTTPPHFILVAINDRDPRLHDVYRVDIRSGERQLVRRNDEGIADWQADLEGNLRLGVRQTQDGGWEILRVDGERLTTVYTCSWEESCSPVRFHRDGRRVCLNTNRGVDLARLTLFDVQTGTEEVVHSDPENQVDLAGAEFSRATHELLATYYVGDRLRIYPKDPQVARDMERLRAALPDGDLYFGSRTRDDRLQIVSVTSDVDPERGTLRKQTASITIPPVL
jgi:hypothetical protein